MGTAEVIKANALELPLPNESVDLVITSPPYFALRSYRDDGEHYGGQIGSEATPGEFVDALIVATREMMRVLKPSGSMWVNLGDKYAGTGGGNGQSGLVGNKPIVGGADHRCHPRNNTKQTSGFVRSKSLMGLPWRYAIRCIDELGLILRAEVIWSKPNGLPESVRDRVRRSHEQWFHFVKSPSYFAGIDEVREAHVAVVTGRKTDHWRPGPSGMNRSVNVGRTYEDGKPVGEFAMSPLGKLPGSVWTVPTEPLKVPVELGLDHFAAFPTAWPSRIIRGWSPTGICTACGDGRVPVTENSKTNAPRPGLVTAMTAAHGADGREGERPSTIATITGYACNCPEPTAPTRPAVVLDPFGGTGTVAMVAKALGRHGISIDLSADYCRLAEWRTNNQKTLFKVRSKVYGEINRRRKRQRNERAAWQ